MVLGRDVGVGHVEAWVLVQEHEHQVVSLVFQVGDEAIDVAVKVDLKLQLSFCPDNLGPRWVLALVVGPVVLKDRQSEFFFFHDYMMDRLSYLRIAILFRLPSVFNDMSD